jgi:tetratricopeptide (TPR) repeat protein
LTIVDMDEGNPLEEVLDDARQRAAAAREQGDTYSVAWHSARAAYALLQLEHNDAALIEFDEAIRIVEAVREDGQHEVREALGTSNLYSGEALPRLVDLYAWTSVGRAAALARLEKWIEAQAAIDACRPLVKGWGRRHLRTSLNEVADEVTRAVGSTQDALAALERVIANPAVTADDRLQARYERAALLLDVERIDEAKAEALLLIRDCDLADDTWTLSAARQVLGAALLASDDISAGTATLRLALQGFLDVGDLSAAVGVAPGLAWTLSEAGDQHGAAGVLNDALPAARGLASDSATYTQGRIAECDLLTAMGSVRDALADAAGALAAFEGAVTIAMSLKDTVRGADARHGEAVVRATRLAHDHDQAVDALALLDSARADYEQAGLIERAAGCQHECAALLARLKSYDAAIARYTAARTTYLELPPVLRDNGSWPDEVADCEANIMLLDRLRQDSSIAIDAGAFASGGHRMRHGE